MLVRVLNESKHVMCVRISQKGLIQELFSVLIRKLPGNNKGGDQKDNICMLPL